MFNLFGSKKKTLLADNNIYTPVNGEAIPIDQTSDSVFASKAMGDGFAVKPDNGTIVSPVAGEVILAASTKHALGFRMANGVEVLVHMGVDTVDLGGAPFDLKVKVGDIVEGGDLIAHMDLKQVTEAGLETDIIVVFTNGADKNVQFEFDGGEAVAGEVMTTITAE